jgi:hypothetical protein
MVNEAKNQMALKSKQIKVMPSQYSDIKMNALAPGGGGMFKITITIPQIVVS